MSTGDKARPARANGYASVIVTGRHRFANDVLALTDGRGADVVFDGLSRDATDENLRALARCGHWVSYGQASGPMESIALSALTDNSLTLSRPVLFHHIADRASLQHTAGSTFDAWRQGILRPLIGHRLALSAAEQAHRLLESRESHGAVVLVP